MRDGRLTKKPHQSVMTNRPEYTAVAENAEACPLSGSSKYVRVVLLLWFAFVLVVMVICFSGDQPVRQKPTVADMVGRWEASVAHVMPFSKPPPAPGKAIPGKTALELFADNTFKIRNYPVLPNGLAGPSGPPVPKNDSGTWEIDYGESISGGWHVQLYFPQERTWWAGFLIIEEEGELALLNYFGENDRICLHKMKSRAQAGTNSPSSRPTGEKAE